MATTQAILSGLAGGLAVWLLAAGARRAPPLRGKGVRVLSWPAGLRWLVAAFVPFSAFVVFAALQARPSQMIMASMVAAGFVTATVYLIYCIALYRVYWTRDGIGSHDPIRGHRFLPWGDVEEGRYVGSVQAFYMKGGKTRVWYSPMQAGVPQLHRYARRRLGPSLVAALPDEEA